MAMVIHPIPVSERGHFAFMHTAMQQTTFLIWRILYVGNYISGGGGGSDVNNNKHCVTTSTVRPLVSMMPWHGNDHWPFLRGIRQSLVDSP